MLISKYFTISLIAPCFVLSLWVRLYTSTIIQVKAGGPTSVVSGNVAFSYDNQTGITTITNSSQNATIGVKTGQRISLGNPSIILPNSNLTNYSDGMYDVLESGNLTILKAVYNTTSGTYNINLNLIGNTTKLFQSLQSGRGSGYCFEDTGLNSYVTGFDNFSVYKVMGFEAYPKSNYTTPVNYTDLVIQPGETGTIKFYSKSNYWDGQLIDGVTFLNGPIHISPSTVGINLNLLPSRVGPLPNQTSTSNSIYNVTASFYVAKNAMHGSYVLTFFPNWCNGIGEPLYVLTVGSSAYVGSVVGHIVAP